MPDVIVILIAVVGVVIVGAPLLVAVLIVGRRRIAYPAPGSLVVPPADAVLTVQPLDGNRYALHPDQPRPAIVYSGQTPDTIDRTQSLTVTVEDGAVVLHAPGDHPHRYFELVGEDGRAVIVADRFIRLNGGLNIRDIGGYHTTDGRQVRWGRVFRAGTLHNLTPESWAYLQGMGVRLVCDMRGEEEIAKEPEALPDGVAYCHAPINAANDTLRYLRTLFLRPERIVDILPEMYTDVMIDDNAAVFGQVVGMAADAEQLPLIIHCTAGKDRTGVSIALLLGVLGVPDETIIADYTLSNHVYPQLHAYAQMALNKAGWMRVRAEDIQPVLTAEARTMRHTLDHIRRRYGSIEAYLIDRAGLDAEVLASIRRNLLV